MQQTEPVPVNVEPTPQLPLGATFTIAGVRLLPNGTFVTDCKPGEETILVNSNRPSIYSLSRGGQHGPTMVACAPAPKQHGPASRKRWR